MVKTWQQLPLDGSEWDRLTASHLGASFFHSSHWARVLQATYGHQLYYLAELDGEDPRGLLPIVEVNSRWTGRRGVSLPFSDECELLCFDGTVASHLLDHALKLGRQRNWKYFELRGDIPVDPQPQPWRSYVRHEVDLSCGVEKLFGGFESSVRRAIRKAEKSGVTVRVLETSDATRAFYQLHCGTRRKHGVPPQPFSFFSNIYEHVFREGKGFIVLAQHEGRTIGASVFVHHGNIGLYKFGASDKARLHLRPNELIMWEGMKWYTSRCYSRLSMGRTALGNQGLRRFKRGFGAIEKPMNYFRYDFRRERYVVGSNETSGGLNKVFALTPLALLRKIGRTLYPHLD